MPPQNLTLGQQAPDPGAIEARVADARLAWARHDRRAAAAHLSAAHTLAHHARLHRRAAEIRHALKILADGGSPKLLTRFPPATHS